MSSERSNVVWRLVGEAKKRKREMRERDARERERDARERGHIG